MSLIKKAFLVGISFFLVAFFTLPHYGINWDTINHLPRGQAYLRYFLTGKKDYSDLKKYQPYWQDPLNLSNNSKSTRSFYQMDDATVDFYISVDGDGHPPLSDILSAAFNRIFFGSLRLVNDIDSYRIYGIFLSACLVGLLYYWISENYGTVAALFTSLSLSVYPLFWAESHFNTEKDIPQTAYWSFLLFCVWKGVTRKSIKWLLLSGIFFGLALGTKFNIIFVVPVIGAWIIFLLISRYLKLVEVPKIIISGLVAIAIGLFIFIITWPYLWADPIGGIQSVLGFYQNISTGPFDMRFIGYRGIRTYPFLWIIYTTPLSILFLSFLGIVYGIRRIILKKDHVCFLFLAWLVVPIVRVTWPGASFYGGVRQIMEYIPVIAIFAGLGAKVLYNKINSTKWGYLILVCLFVPITVKLIQIHPNENVYFNPLIGGLFGAKQSNLPYWGFSFGNPYRQGIEWINSHAEKGANIVFAHELIPNIPMIWVRPDLQFYNAARSGYLRLGEYAMTLTYQGIEDRSYYEMYLDKFIEPVYQVTVDGVTILTVWKNDEDHLKTKWTENIISNVKLTKTDTTIKFDFGQEKKLSRLELNYDQNNCQTLSYGSVRISRDGITWSILPGDLPDDWRVAVLGQQPKNGRYVEPFVGQLAQYIEISVFPTNACLKKIQDFKIYYFL